MKCWRLSFSHEGDKVHDLFDRSPLLWVTPDSPVRTIRSHTRAQLPLTFSCTFISSACYSTTTQVPATGARLTEVKRPVYGPRTS